MSKNTWSKDRPQKPNRDPMLDDLVELLVADKRSTFAKANVSDLSPSTLKNWENGKVGQFEAKLDFDYAYTSPSAQFNEVMRKKRSRGSYVSSASLSYYTKYSPAAPAESKSLQDEIMEWAYDPGIPEQLQELLKRLLRCEITEPKPIDPNDDGIPF